MLLLTLSALAQTVQSDVLKRADYFDSKGEYDMAFKLYEQSANEGNMTAMRKLAYAYLTGRGTVVDGNQSTSYYLKAAQLGDATSMYMLVNSYYNGVGVDKNPEQALKWLQKAAENNSVDALRLLAECYEDGNGMAKNSEKAKILLGRADSIENSIIASLNRSVAAVKSTSSEGHALETPTIRILYPENQYMFHEGTIKLRYYIENSGGRTFRVSAMVNGESQPESRSVSAADAIDVDLPKKDCLIQLILKDDVGTVCGEPSSIQLRWDRSFDQLILPNLYIFAVGIGDYHDKNLPPLRYAVKDCQDFVSAMTSKKGKPYQDVYTHILLNTHATRDSIYEGISWLKRHATQNDVAVFYYAGHGFRDEKDRFYFANIDGDTEKSYKNISAEDFKRQIDDVSGKVVLFIDACYSAAIYQNTRSAAAEHFVEQLSRAGDGIVMYASSSADTKSREDERWQNGVFTKVLVEALNGAAKKNNREGLSVNELGFYLEERVKELTDCKQIPKYINPGNIDNFNLFLYEKE
jgi:hypothetical protein